MEIMDWVLIVYTALSYPATWYLVARTMKKHSIPFEWLAVFAVVLSPLILPFVVIDFISEPKESDHA